MVVYIRNELNAKETTDLMKNKNIECIWIKINGTKSKLLVIGSIYRPLHAAFYSYISDFEDQLQKLDLAKIEFAIIDDFNADLLSKSRSKSIRQSVRSFLLANNLEQSKNLPTRVCESSKTFIDPFCVNNKHRVLQTEVISSSIGDHSIIMCVFKSGVPKIPPRAYESRTSQNFVREDFLKIQRMSHGMLLMEINQLMMLFYFGGKCSVKERRSTHQLKWKGSNARKLNGSTTSYQMSGKNVTITIVKHAVIIVHTIGTCTKSIATILIKRTVA